MDRDVSTDQGSFPIHGIRDVRLKADTEQHDWSELAAIPEVNTLSADPKSYNTRGGSSCRGPQMRVRLSTTAIFGNLSG